MSAKTWKLLFYFFWLAALILIPITVFSNSPISVAFKYPVTTASFMLRILGLTAYTLLFFQIILGSNLPFWIEKTGAWVFAFHIYEGVAIYSLVILHPVFFLFFNYFAGHGIDPFYVFTQVCLICQTKNEYYLTLGRISFWLINITVFSGLFRALTPFMRVHWRQFHVLNYLIFILVGIHGFFTGTDFRSWPFFGFAILSYLIILYVIVVQKLPELYRASMLWLKTK